MSGKIDFTYYCLKCESFVPDAEVDNEVLFATHRCGAEVAVYLAKLPGAELLEDGVPARVVLGGEE